jgi:pimeloyl-ACP methyl ester carboxylesterase
MLNLRTLAATLLLGVSPLALHAQLPAALTTDPAPDKSFPATLETMQIPSHGAALNALVYVAAGPGPHPTVVLLHGFPGNEKNLDLAQSIRRAGWNVLFFNYRGSWGSPGDFSFAHAQEDVQSALVYLRDPANAKTLRVDPTRLVLIGHSMGGFMAAYTGAHDPHLRAVALISAADMAGRAAMPPGAPASARPQVISGAATALEHEGMAPLAGCTPTSLATELVDHATDWAILPMAAKLAAYPMLVVSSDDGLAAATDALVAALRTDGDRKVEARHLPTDHSYSDHRIELQTIVLHWLQQQTNP